MLIAIGLIEPTQSPGPPTRIPGSSLPHVVSERFYQNFFYRNFLLQNNVNRPNIDYFILNSAVLKQSLFLFIINCSRFYRAAWNAVCPSVCPSVCLTNAWIVTKLKKDQSRFLYHTKDHLAWFSKKKNGWWGDPFYLKVWSSSPRWSEIADFEPIFALSASYVTPSEKSSINTNRKSTTRFPMSLR